MIILAYKRRWLRAAQSVLVALFFIPAGMSGVYAATAQEEAALELFNEGFQLYQSGNFERAKERFEDSLELVPKNTTALYYLGRVLEAQGDFYNAMANYQAVFDSGPDTKDGILAKSAKNRLDSLIKSWDEKVNAKDENGDTPLHSAAEEGDREAATLLLEIGAAVNAKNNDGETPLHKAAGSFENAVATATLLIERGAAVNAKDNDGRTPLHRVMYPFSDIFNNDAVAIATLLLERGAAVNAKDRWGYTPLHRAASAFKNAVATTLLVERGAAVNAKNNDGETPLHKAAGSFENAVATATLLLERGATVNAKDRWGYTPLHRAANNSAVATATLLLERGATVNAKNNDGETPLAILFNSQAYWKKEAKEGNIYDEEFYKKFKKEAKKTAALLGQHGGKE